MGSNVEVSVQPDSFPTLVSPYTCSAFPVELRHSNNCLMQSCKQSISEGFLEHKLS